MELQEVSQAYGNVYYFPKDKEHRTFTGILTLPEQSKENLLCEGFARSLDFYQLSQESVQQFYIPIDIIRLFQRYWDESVYWTFSAFALTQFITWHDQNSTLLSKEFVIENVSFVAELDPNGFNPSSRGSVIYGIRIISIPDHYRAITLQYELKCVEMNKHWKDTMRTTKPDTYTWHSGTLQLADCQNAFKINDNNTVSDTQTLTFTHRVKIVRIEFSKNQSKNCHSLNLRRSKHIWNERNVKMNVCNVFDWRLNHLLQSNVAYNDGQYLFSNNTMDKCFNFWYNPNDNEFGIDLNLLPGNVRKVRAHLIIESDYWNEKKKKYLIKKMQHRVTLQYKDQDVIMPYSVERTDLCSQNGFIRCIVQITKVWNLKGMIKQTKWKSLSIY